MTDMEQNATKKEINNRYCFIDNLKNNEKINIHPVQKEFFDKNALFTKIRQEKEKKVS